MRKISTAIACLTILACATSSYAAVKIAAQPNQPYNGKDYVAKIVAASYETQSVDGQQSILIMTDKDDLSESNLTGLTIKIDEKDLPFGFTLANSVGKKIAVSFANPNYDISSVQIITDKYWNGANNKS